MISSFGLVSRARALAILFGITLVALLLHPSPASAHSVLLGTVPSDEEQLAGAPESVSLTFNEDITELGTEVIVTTEDGEVVSEGKVKITGPTISQDLTDARPKGAYTVTWRAVSADGHPISGEFVFTAADDVGIASEEEPGDADAGESSDDVETDTPEPTETTEPAATDDEAPADDDASGLSASTWVIIGVLIIAAVILVTSIARGMASSKRRE